MMKDLFVPYEIALALKEIGFDEPCFSFYYWYDNETWRLNGEYQSMIEFPMRNTYFEGDKRKKKRNIAAPLYDQVIDWFIEKHHLVLWVTPEGEFGRLYWRAGFMDLTRKAKQYQQTMGEDYFNHYENDFGTKETKYEALNMAILDGIELIKQKK